MLTADQFQSIQLQLLIQHDALKDLKLRPFMEAADAACAEGSATEEQRTVLKVFRELAEKLQAFADVKLGFDAVILGKDGGELATFTDGVELATITEEKLS